MSPSRGFALCLLCAVATAGGCATDRAAQADAMADASCRRADSLIRQTQTQVATLRSEMATIRIEAAKKDAELERLRRRVETLQGERVELQETRLQHETAMEEQGETLQAVRRERDELVEAKRRLESELAGVSSAGVSPEAGLASGPADNKVEALEASIVALTTQIQHLRGQEGGDPENAGAPSVFSIRVARGDTLGKLAKRYGVTVVDIQEANGLTGDLIHVGQRLFIPRAPLLSPAHTVLP